MANSVERRHLRRGYSRPAQIIGEFAFLSA
jgi:hypothetical protein